MANIDLLLFVFVCITLAENTEQNLGLTCQITDWIFNCIKTVNSLLKLVYMASLDNSISRDVWEGDDFK